MRWLKPGWRTRNQAEATLSNPKSGFKCVSDPLDIWRSVVLQVVSHGTHVPDFAKRQRDAGGWDARILCHYVRQ